MVQHFLLFAALAFGADFASLRASRVNMRTGPGDNYPVQWIFVRPNLPVKVIDTFDIWRKIQDPDGEEGWVHKTMLSSKPMVYVHQGQIPLLSKPELNSPILRLLEKGVIGYLKRQEGQWCLIKIQTYEGWVQTSHIFGVPH